MPARSNPTETEQRLERLEHENAQLKGAVRDLCKLVTRHKGIPWGTPEYAESDLARVVGEPGIERRPYQAPEQREAA